MNEDEIMSTYNEVHEPIQVFMTHWNRPDTCGEAVRAFLQQEIPVKLTVLDNGSDEAALRRLVKLIPSTVVIWRLERNYGFGPALNIGLRSWLQEGEGDFVIAGPDDVVPAAGCLRLLAQAMQERPGVGIVSPEGAPGQTSAFSGWRGPYVRTIADARDVVPQTFPDGTLMMFRRRCLQEVGCFDERYFVYGEEMDLGLRCWARGWEVAVVRGAGMKNLGTSVGSPVACYLQVRNALLVVKDWAGWHWAALRSLMSLGNAFLLLLWRSGRPSAYSFRARLLAVRDVWARRYGAPPASLWQAKG